jgi:hypothetical protein
VATVVEGERLRHGIQYVAHEFFVAAAVAPVTAMVSSPFANAHAESRLRYSWVRPWLAETLKGPVRAKLEVPLVVILTLTVVDELEWE